jgi:hypothetical protein
MSKCQFPEHHSSGSGGGSAAAAGLLLTVIAGVLIATHLRAVIIALAVAAGVAVAGIFARAAIRSHRPARMPYDAAWHDSEHQAAEPAAAVLTARVAQLERQLARRQAAPRAIAPPAVHQHLHLHGMDAAAIIASRQPGHASPATAGRYIAITREDQSDGRRDQPC